MPSLNLKQEYSSTVMHALNLFLNRIEFSDQINLRLLAVLGPASPSYPGNLLRMKFMRNNAWQKFYAKLRVFTRNFFIQT